MQTIPLPSLRPGALKALLREAGRTLICSARSRHRQAQAMRALDEHLLADIGILRTEMHNGSEMHTSRETAPTNMPPRVRTALAADIPAIQAIYAHHVLHGRASFELTPPSAEEMAARFGSVAAHGLPYLVAEVDGRTVGYSYAMPHHARPAYSHTIDDSVYVDADFAGRGIGHALLATLIEQCRQGPWRQMIAVIGDSGNQASIGLHDKLGFRRVGTLTEVGFKFGSWLDVVIMQKSLHQSSR